MKILLTGASGYLGARLYQDLHQSFNVVGTYHNDAVFSEHIRMDVTDAASVFSTIAEQQPDVIVHAAAVPSGRFCEGNEEEATKINVEGTKHVVEAANQVGASIILISTVMVAGDDVYARTKQAAEEAVQACTAGYIILRPALILGASPNRASDRPWNRLVKNITEKSDAIYDTAWQTQITYIGQIGKTIEAIIDHGGTNDIISITSPELKSRYEIAQDILKEFDVEVSGIVDESNTYPIVVSTQDKMHEYEVAVMEYDVVIEKCVEELQEEIS